MIQFLHRLAGLRVLVVGDAILDEYLTGDCSRLSPEAPVPVVRVGDVRHVLGGAANTAANVAALGGRPTLISLTGSDAAGESLSESCRASAINLVALRDGRPTLRKTRVVGQHQQLVRLDYEAVHPVDTQTESRLLTLFGEHLAAADIVVFSDYAKGILSRTFCQEAIAAAHARGCEVVIDPRPQHREFYRHGDYLTPNWKESCGLLGVPEDAPSAERVDRTGWALASALDTNLILTLGANGMAFFGRDGSEHFSVPTQAREVFDVSGAGDTVVAAFALARAAGASHHDAIALANAAAGIVVGKFGTATVTAAELLEAHHEAAPVVPRHELAGLAASLRAKGKRIVTINGSFDVLHPGHLHILREARRQGDVLIVGLNSDESVRSYKGPSRPIFTADRRAEMLLALRFVDYVHVFDETVPIPFLEEVRPDVHVNGAEYGSDCVEAGTVKRLGGQVHLVDRLPEFASTQIMSRMV